MSSAAALRVRAATRDQCRNSAGVDYFMWVSEDQKLELCRWIRLSQNRYFIYNTPRTFAHLEILHWCGFDRWAAAKAKKFVAYFAWVGVSYQFSRSLKPCVAGSVELFIVLLVRAKVEEVIPPYIMAPACVTPKCLLATVAVLWIALFSTAESQGNLSSPLPNAVFSESN